MVKALQCQRCNKTIVNRVKPILTEKITLLLIFLFKSLLLLSSLSLLFVFFYHYLGETSGKRKLDLVAVISGGAEVTRGLQKNITLNASLSYDPEVAHGNRSGMKFTWHYGKVARNHSSKQAEAKADKDFFMAVNESAIYYNRNASGELVSLNTEALSVNQTYIVKLVLTKDSRISTVYQVIHLIEGDPPEIYQRLGSTLSLLLISLFGLFLQLFSLPLLIPIFALDPAIAFIFATVTSVAQFYLFCFWVCYFSLFLLAFFYIHCFRCQP